MVRPFQPQRPAVDREALAQAVDLALQEGKRHAHLLEQLRDALLAKDQNAVNALACQVVGLPPMEVLE